MEFHRESLQSICRLCGGSSNCMPVPTHKATLSSDLQSAFDINIKEDDDSIHPSFICNCCRMKIFRWKKKKRKSPCNISLYTFKVHSLSCRICFESKEDVKDDFFDTAVKAGLEIGYAVRRGSDCVYFAELTDDFKRVKKRIVIRENGDYDIEVHGRILKQYPPEVPRQLKANTCHSLLSYIHRSTICIGNPDFTNLCRYKSLDLPATFKNAKREQVAYEERGYLTYDTVRHEKCELLNGTPGKKQCNVCSIYKASLHHMASSTSSKPLSSLTTNHTRNDLLSFEILKEKTKELFREKKSLKRKLSNMADYVKSSIKANGEKLDDRMSNSLLEVMKENTEQVNEEFPVGSVIHLLWEQQKQAAAAPPSHRRWHPSVIKWCISLHLKSPAAYKMIRGSKFLILPHENTLRDYSQFSENKTGYNIAIIKKIKENLKFNEMSEYKRNVSIVFDEMKIKSGLVYSKKTGNLVGFTKLGSINDNLQDFVNMCDSQNKENEDESNNPDTTSCSAPLATHILAVMVRGICSTLNTVIGWFPCIGFNSNQLYWCLWRGVSILEVAQFKVRAFVSDGASPNRKFYRIHGTEENQPVYYTRNPCDSGRRLYFICDVPHLIKTTRNNFENSGWNNKTRNLHYRGQEISWKHMVDLVENDIGISGTNGVVQLRHLPRLTHEHIYLTPSLRMRVKLAAQVLSTTVANAFAREGRHNTKSTELFIRKMDQFFDCLNVSRTGQDIRCRKEALAPYRQVNDWRFKWLKEDFLGFLNDWEQAALNTPHLSMKEKRKQCLSRETLEGLRITVHSFIDLTKEMLQIDGVQFILSEKFSQDPIEEYFSRQRGCLGRHDNPTVAEFGRNALAIEVAGSRHLKPSRGSNCTNENATR